MSTLLGWIVVLSLIAVLITIGRFTRWADRRRVVRMITRAGGEVVSICQIHPSIARQLLSERNTTFWRVTYRTRDGEMRRADCFASYLRCKVYDDQPIAVSDDYD
jgi:hypothetical protein